MKQRSYRVIIPIEANNSAYDRVINKLMNDYNAVYAERENPELRTLFLHALTAIELRADRAVDWVESRELEWDGDVQIIRYLTCVLHAKRLYDVIDVSWFFSCGKRFRRERQGVVHEVEDRKDLELEALEQWGLPEEH